jgi:hypothetical protein
VSYSQALEQQMGMLRRTEGDAGVLHAEITIAALEDGGVIQDRDTLANLMEAARQAAIETLTVATPYYWAPEICELIETTGASLPGYSLRPEDLPTPAGFCWFPRPMLLPVPEGRPDLEAISRMPSFMWARLASGEGIWYCMTQSTTDWPQGQPATSGLWDFGQSLDDVVNGMPPCTQGADGIPPEMVTARVVKQLRVMATSFVFMNQRILATVEECPDRPTRKRAAALLETVPTIQVVKLRRVSPGSPSESEHDVEWSCRWVVSGHWREQYYPSTKEHRPKFILPYVKGPDDKPLRNPAQRIFAVSR